MNRRCFLYNTSLTGLSMIGAGFLPPLALKALAGKPNLRITKVETVRFSEKLKVDGRGIQWMWLRLHTNEGIVGTGETYPFNEASEGVFKDLEWHSWAGKLLGANIFGYVYETSKVYRLPITLVGSELLPRPRSSGRVKVLRF